jgi:hypothetical protein
LSENTSSTVYTFASERTFNYYKSIILWRVTLDIAGVYFEIMYQYVKWKIMKILKGQSHTINRTDNTMAKRQTMVH